MKKEIITITFLAVVCLAFSGCLPKNKQPQAPKNSAPETTNNVIPDKNDDVSIKQYLKNMFNEQDKLEYKITYNIKGSGTGIPEEMQNLEVTSTHYQKGNKTRADTMVMDMTSRVYIIDETTYICTQVGASWSCLDHGKPVDDETKKMKQAFINEMDSYNIKSLGKKTIADTSTDCYEMAKKDNSMKTEICVASEKVPLYVKMTIRNEDNKAETMTTEMTATSFSTSVTDSDFILPSEPTKPNPGLPGIGCEMCDMLEGEIKENCLKVCE